MADHLLLGKLNELLDLLPQVTRHATLHHSLEKVEYIYKLFNVTNLQQILLIAALHSVCLCYLPVCCGGTHCDSDTLVSITCITLHNSATLVLTIQFTPPLSHNTNRGQNKIANNCCFIF